MASGHDDSAKYYKGRAPYSPKMAARLATGLGFSGDTRILDVACGNGALSTVIAPHVGHITGLDVSKAMLSNAEPHPKIRYLEWDFNKQPVYQDGSRFHHVTLGRALQWLSFRKLSETFRDTIEPGGFLIVCDARFDQSSGWYAEFRRLLERYGRWRVGIGSAAQEKLPMIGFRRHGQITEQGEVRLTPDLVLLHALSLQPVTKAIEANPTKFKAELAELLRPHLSNGAVTVTSITIADAWTR